MHGWNRGQIQPWAFAYMQATTQVMLEITPPTLWPCRAADKRCARPRTSISVDKRMVGPQPSSATFLSLAESFFIGPACLVE